MSHGTVAMVIGCVDCRLQHEDASTNRQFRELLGADKVYVKTVAGPEGRILSDNHHLQAIVEDTQLIIDAKGASIVAVCGHYDCAGHPVTDGEHDRDVVKAAGMLRQRLNLEGSVIPLVAKQGDNDDSSTWVIVQVGEPFVSPT